MLHRPPTAKDADPALGVTSLMSLGALLVLLLGFVGASAWQAGVNADALDRLQATQAQRSLIADIVLAAVDAESAQRGFLLTHNSDYLQPMVAAQAALPGLLAALRSMPATEQDSPSLIGLLDTKLAELRRTLAMAETGATQQALAVVRTNAGREMMVQFRAQAQRMEAELDAATGLEVENVARGGRLLVVIDSAGLVMVLALGMLIAVGLRRYFIGLRQMQALTVQANAALEVSNERLDETVQARTADLTAANAEIQRFAYIVSHDLRAPLVNIMGFTSELEQAAKTLATNVEALAQSPDLREAVTEEIPEALRFIRSSTSKMDRLINAILRLSREGRRVLAPERVEMAGLVAAVSESLRHQAQSKGATIEAGALPTVTADRLAVEQVFGNVLDNALKYLRPGVPGVVRVSGEAEGTMIRYEIADNGRGIAERDYERVFELFRRAGDQSVPGEGIGLAHVRALVRKLGGSIECRSTVDVGTTFTIRLPAVPHPVLENAA